MTEFQKVKDVLEEMEEYNKALWCLLSLCRVKQPFLILAELDGCGEIHCIEAFLETCKQAVLGQEPVALDQYEQLLERVDYVCAGMYINEDGEADYLPVEEDKSGTELAEGFRPAHFGNLNAAIIQLLKAGFPRVQYAGNGAEVIMGATFQDYFYDKYGTDNVPEIHREMDRIWSDHTFLLGHPSQMEIEARMEEYKATQIWQA